MASKWRDAGFKSSSALHEKVRQIVPLALEHTGAAAFDEHLVGVESVVRCWTGDEDLAKAALFHSIYGTEGFQGFALPLSQRPQIRKIIGTKAERLAWLYCCLDRTTFDRAVESGQRTSVAARPELGGFALGNTEDEFKDLCILFLADICEQMEGVAKKEVYGWAKGAAWGYRRYAYRGMKKICVEELGLKEAGVMYDAVFAQEPDGIPFIAKTPPLTEAAKQAELALLSISL